MPVLLAGAIEFGGAALEGLGLWGAAEGGAAALGAEAGAGLFGAAETGAGALGIGEAAGAGLGAAEAGSTALGLGEAAGLFGGGAEAATEGASLASLAGGGGIDAAGSTAATSFDVAGATSGASTGLDALSKSASGVAPAAGGDASTFGKLISGISNNPLQAAGVGIAGAGLGYNMLQGSKDSAERKALGTNAKMLGTQGKELMSYLQSGTLPPGLQMLMDKETAASRARVIQNAAQNGMPTDPSQNSALAQELNNIDQQAMIKTAQLGQQLLTQGITEVGMADDLYAKLIGIDKAQAQSTGLAISNFAAALGGRPQMQQQRAA